MSADADQECTVEIDAPLQLCFDVITDFGTYPEWNAAIAAVEVEKESRGLARRVAFDLDARVKTIRYVLEYSYRKPRELSWKSVSGDVENISGTYRFAKLDDDHTEATCHQTISLGFWLPGPLKRLAEATALEQSVGEFKAEAERRAAQPKRRRRRP